MSYKVDTILLFVNQAKHLIKKYPSGKNDLLYLSAIFDKGEKSTISNTELKSIFKTVP